MMSEPKLTEAQREALVMAIFGTHEPALANQTERTRLWQAVYDQFAEDIEYAAPVIERILAEHTQALEADVERLKRGGKTLGKSLDYWMRLAQQVTGSDDVIQDDGDGDWGVVAERLAALGARAEAAEAEVERLREGLTELARAAERDDRGNARALADRLRTLLDEEA